MLCNSASIYRDKLMWMHGWSQGTRTNGNASGRCGASHLLTCLLFREADDIRPDGIGTLLALYYLGVTIVCTVRVRRVRSCQDGSLLTTLRVPCCLLRLFSGLFLGFRLFSASLRAFFSSGVSTGLFAGAPPAALADAPPVSARSSPDTEMSPSVPILNTQ